MPPLLSPKIRCVAQLLAERQQETDAGFEQAGVEDRWAAIVFVETKVSIQPGMSVLLHAKQGSSHGFSCYMVGPRTRQNLQRGLPSG